MDRGDSLTLVDAVEHAAEGRRAEAECRHGEAGLAEPPRLHAHILLKASRSGTTRCRCRCCAWRLASTYPVRRSPYRETSSAEFDEKYSRFCAIRILIV